MENITLERLHIEFSAQLDNIKLVESFIDNVKEKFSITDDLYGNIVISITEAVNNAILHGSASNPAKMVKLSFIIDEEKVIGIVEDQGSGFDYQNLPDPTAPENIHKVGGRGVFLIKNLADKVIFHDQGRKIEMVFNLK